MKVLVTSGASALSQRLADSISSEHSVLLTDCVDIVTQHDFTRSDLDHSSATNDLVRGVDVIVHPGESDPAADASSQLDYQMRCTYNLLRAAVEEKVPRFVYLSSLQLMDLYDEKMAVTERWKTRPTTEPPSLCYHLGEMVCREFAREHGVSVVILRLGDLTDDAAPDPSTSALYFDDAANAVSKALDAELSGWLDIFHVQSDVPNARYLTGQPWWSADDVSPSFSLGYAPRERS